MQYKINGFHDADANNAKFEAADGTMISVADYYATALSKPIQYPRLPLVRVGAKKSKKMRLFPLEYCIMKANQKVKKVSEEQIANLIKFAAKPSDQLERHIGILANEARSALQDVCDEYGLEVGNKMANVSAKVYKGPLLEFGKGSTTTPEQSDNREGKGGNVNIRGKSFFKAADVGNFLIINCSRPNDQGITAMANALKNVGKGFGMNFGNFKIQQAGGEQDIENFMRTHKDDVGLVIVIMRNKNSHDYSYIKKIAELDIGVMTQCLLEKTVNKKDRSGNYDAMTATNILLKINQKCDGTNWRMDRSIRPRIWSKPVMVIGASLSHSFIPGGASIAALSASMDSGCVVYTGQCSIQDKTHLILDIEKFTVEALKQFHECTKGKKPEAVIYYRDGLGEGQYNDAVKYEVTKIRSAFRQMGDDYRPGLTMLSVQRRHHVKFFCQEEKDTTGKQKNVQAGTCIDHGPVSDNFFEFYMYAHAGIMGTSRPAHYLLLHDDNNLSPESLKIMSYFLCHCYARCTRTVAMPVCVYYAQLIAQRGRYWLKNLGYDMDDSMSVSSGGSGGSNTEARRRQLAAQQLSLNENMKDKMFFC